MASPYPTIQLMGRSPLPKQIRSPEPLSPPPVPRQPPYPVLAAVSSGCPGLRGRLATCYAPVRHSPLPVGSFPFDLHVLGTPPTFILSQDQTRRLYPAPCPVFLSGAPDSQPPPAGRTGLHRFPLTRCQTAPPALTLHAERNRSLPPPYTPVKGLGGTEAYFSPRRASSSRIRAAFSFCRCRPR